MKLEELSTDGSSTAELEKEVKEKNLLIGKLRHEGEGRPGWRALFYHTDLSL